MYKTICYFHMYLLFLVLSYDGKVLHFLFTLSNFLLRIIIRHIINFFFKKNLIALYHSNFALFESTDFDFHENQYKELEKYMVIKIISRGTLQLNVLIPRSML